MSRDSDELLLYDLTHGKSSGVRIAFVLSRAHGLHFSMGLWRGGGGLTTHTWFPIGSPVRSLCLGGAPGAMHLSPSTFVYVEGCVVCRVCSSEQCVCVCLCRDGCVVMGVARSP